MSTTEFRIAVIGPSQSGKTCLAVGLSATRTPGFSVVPRDADATAYLTDRKIEISGGKWPPANSKGANRSIRLDFVKSGCEPILVDFPEYGGEILRDEAAFKEFANEYLRDLGGVVLLLNPGSDAFQSGNGSLLEDTMAQYTRAVSAIADKNRNKRNLPIMAIVVTAADRIAPGGDLHDKCAVFDECKQEVEDLVHAHSFSHKWFHVTITGRLKNQNSPELAKGRRNSASKPFLWLLWKLKWGPILFAMLRRIGCVAAVVAVLAALVGGYFLYRAKQADAGIREVGKKLQHQLSGSDDVPNDGDLKKLVGLLKELDGNPRKLARETICEYEPRIWADLKRRIDSKIDEIKIDAAEHITNVTEEAILKVDNLFKMFDPHPQFEPPKSNYDRRLNEWDDNKREIRVGRENWILTENVRKPLDGLVGRHGENILTMLFGLYGELDKVNPPLDYSDLIAKKDDLAKRLDKRVSEEFRALNKYDGMKPDKAKERAAFLQEHLASWRPETEDGSTAKVKLQDEISNESQRFVTEEEARLRKICTDWVDIYLKSERRRSGKNRFWEDYKAFAGQNRDNPFLESVVKKAVYEQTERWFEGDVKFFYGVLYRDPLWSDAKNFPAARASLEERFDEMAKLCEDVASDKNPCLSSWAWHFAKHCMEQGHVREGFFRAFPQTLVIERIEGTISYYDEKKKKVRYPTNYRRTAFAARVEVVQWNKNGNELSRVPTPLLPFDDKVRNAKNTSDNSCDKKHPSMVLLGTSVSIPIHPFEEIQLVSAVTDWIAWGGVTMEPTTHLDRRYIGKFDQNDKLDGLKNLDLSFKLGHTDGVEKPKFTLSITARVDGDGIGDYLAKAKNAAAKAVTSGK